MKASDRLIKYVQYDTGSTEDSAECPSNPKERIFADALADELRSMGAEEVEVDDNGYVYATIPATSGCEDLPVMGLIAHMDTSPDAPNEGVKPQVIHYEGGDIVQNADKGYKISAEDFPFIENYKGCDIITSDGTTLLGADNKAGVAEILSLAELYLKPEQSEYAGELKDLAENGIFKHGKIRIGFTPDEEIGRSSDLFDLKKFGAAYAYTVDGDAFGECQSETFNAASAKIKIHGVGIHPGSAKGKMINAGRLAVEFDSMLPQDERPENTDGYDGFYHLTSINAGVEEASLSYILRDHDHSILEHRAERVHAVADYMNEKYGGTKDKPVIEADVTYEYRNMKEVLDDHPDLVQIPIQVITEMGYEPDTAPIRGGTDGAFLAFKGLPCPNLGPGGHNFHSKNEFAVVQSMDKAVEMLVRIMNKFAEK